MYKSKCINKLAVIIIFAILLMLHISQVALASEVPYDTYNYNFYEDIVFTPAAYIPSGSISGTQLKFNNETIGAFSNPQDICKSPKGEVVIADTGNNRIVILDYDMTKVINIIENFDNKGTMDKFNSPFGVCVSKKYEIYIADSMNRRIVVLNWDGELVKIVSNPTSEILEDNFVFSPLKIIVDYADRIYCIAQNMFEGIMVFEESGDFISFFGTIDVEISLKDKFWKRLASKEERANQRLYIPTEFTGMDIDLDGFVYASNIDPEGMQAVRRLNPRGQDVIKKGKSLNVGGDLWIAGYNYYAGPSQITDVVYREKGIYSLLDRKRGRIFTYDHEGNLLYIFGGMGTQAGTFLSPVAIENIADTILVLDSNRSEILTFQETEYGNLINHAVGLRFDGDETKAVELWERVLKIDENNELAYVGIGKAYLSAGDYTKAMKYLKLGMSSEYYSIAFKRYRNAILKENMNTILSGTAILVVVVRVSKKIYRKKKGIKEEEGLLHG